MRLRRRSRSERVLDYIAEAPWWQRATALAVPAAAALGAAVYTRRRHVWQGIALAASAVEEVADTIEDAAESLRDGARKRATA
ncbi:MAG TPA: hypothetical protein VKC65_00875 [Gaiellaceae bacterium]|nr:hypothetical protein [Gaiellaceae bacterium]